MFQRKLIGIGRLNDLAITFAFSPVTCTSNVKYLVKLYTEKRIKNHSFNVSIVRIIHLSKDDVTIFMGTQFIAHSNYDHVYYISFTFIMSVVTTLITTLIVEIVMNWEC